METASPAGTLFGMSATDFGTLLAAMATLAMLFVLYTVMTVRDPMAKRVKALNERREQLKAGITASTARRRAKLARLMGSPLQGGVDLRVFFLDGIWGSQRGRALRRGGPGRRPAQGYDGHDGRSRDNSCDPVHSLSSEGGKHPEAPRSTPKHLDAPRRTPKRPYMKKGPTLSHRAFDK